MKLSFAAFIIQLQHVFHKIISKYNFIGNLFQYCSLCEPSKSSKSLMFQNVHWIIITHVSNIPNMRRGGWDFFRMNQNMKLLLLIKILEKNQEDLCLNVSFCWSPCLVHGRYKPPSKKPKLYCKCPLHTLLSKCLLHSRSKSYYYHKRLTRIHTHVYIEIGRKQSSMTCILLWIEWYK